MSRGFFLSGILYVSLVQIWLDAFGASAPLTCAVQPRFRMRPSQGTGLSAPFPPYNMTNPLRPGIDGQACVLARTSVFVERPLRFHVLSALSYVTYPSEEQTGRPLEETLIVLLPPTQNICTSLCHVPRPSSRCLAVKVHTLSARPPGSVVPPTLADLPDEPIVEKHRTNRSPSYPHAR